MNAILAIAQRHGLKVIEDAAQGVMARYQGKALGSIGDLGAYSFHETKNVISGEGGAILVNDPGLIHRAEIIREKGTDRSRFFRGEVDKYTWQEVGSSFLPGELIAAFLWAQLEVAERITQARLASWHRYHVGLEGLEKQGVLRRPIIPADCEHNAHMYYILLAPEIDRQMVLNELKQEGIGSVFHYIPLHSSPAGQRYGRTHGDLDVTNFQSERLVRLPLWVGIANEEIDRVIQTLEGITHRQRVRTV
jgi:dTDP-4-amino-4,6-dideoxygalactose transaminase